MAQAISPYTGLYHLRLPWFGLLVHILVYFEAVLWLGQLVYTLVPFQAVLCLGLLVTDLIADAWVQSSTSHMGLMVTRVAPKHFFFPPSISYFSFIIPLVFVHDPLILTIILADVGAVK
jgi:hypothetical protein